MNPVDVQVGQRVMYRYSPWGAVYYQAMVMEVKGEICRIWDSEEREGAEEKTVPTADLLAITSEEGPPDESVAVAVRSKARGRGRGTYRRPTEAEKTERRKRTQSKYQDLLKKVRIVNGLTKSRFEALPRDERLALIHELRGRPRWKRTW